MKHFFKNFSFLTLRGKVYFLVGLFVIFLIAFSALISFRLSRTTKYNNKITGVRMPLINVNKEVLHAIDKSMALSRAYILTGNPKLAEERSKNWEDASHHAIGVLKKFSFESEGADSNLDLDSICYRLEAYGKVQKELDEIVKHHFLDIDNLQNDSTVSDTTKAFIAQSYRQGMFVQISNHIQSNIAELEMSLINSVDDLLSEQEALLANDLSKNRENLFNTYLITIIISVLACIISMFLAFIIAKSLLKSVNRPREFLDKLSLGEIPDDIDSGNDEMRPIIKAGNKVRAMLKSASQFSTEVGKGNFEYEFKPASNQDLLGNSLLAMRGKLAKLAEEEGRRNWISSGIAAFSNILRNANKDIKEVGDEVLAELIKYIGAIQGGLFVLNDTDKESQFLELATCFAYDRKKHLEKKLKVGRKFGEGLVGQAYIEKETVILKELPASYMKIDSGLGEVEPKCLLLVPLKVNDTVKGVLEIASLEIIEDYKVEFVERISENLASTIVSLKNYSTTQRLLLESQEREEELRAQEEEMRQSVEELSATQEEMGRKQGELLTLRENLEQEVALQTQSFTKQKENFVMMTSAVPGVIFQLHYKGQSKGEFTFVSEGLKELANIEPDEMDQLSVFEGLMEEDVLEDFKQVLEESAQSSNNVDWEGRILVKEDFKWVKVLARAGRDAEGQMIFHGTISDISSRKEEQEQFKIQNLMLEKQEEETRKVLADMSEKQSEYEVKIEAIEGRTKILERVVSIDEDLVFEVNGTAAEDAVWYERFSDSFGYPDDIRTFGALLSNLLGDAKSDFEKALNEHIESGHLDEFTYNTQESSLRIKLLAENDKVIKLLGAVRSVKLFSEESMEARTNDVQVIVGTLEVAFDEKTGQISADIYGKKVVEILSISQQNHSFDELQSLFRAAKGSLPFAEFVKQALLQEKTDELSWAGTWYKKKEKSISLELRVLKSIKGKTAIALLLRE